MTRIKWGCVNIRQLAEAMHKLERDRRLGTGAPSNERRRHAIGEGRRCRAPNATPVPATLAHCLREKRSDEADALKNLV